ncbi:MAG: DoxX family protein [Acidobacteriota bacterium]|nr:DoxX family protein [Bryobacteraceae bacterium CoA2 C42]
MIDFGLLTLRIGFGLGMAALHGASKVASAWAHLRHGADWDLLPEVVLLGFPWPLAFALAATAAEFGAALLLACGLFTRASAAALSFTMLMAARYHAIAGGIGEPAAAYSLVFLTLAITGGGRYAADAYLFRRRVHP